MLELYVKMYSPHLGITLCEPKGNFNWSHFCEKMLYASMLFHGFFEVFVEYLLVELQVQTKL